MRRQECLATRGRSAVDGDLNQRFFDLVDRYAAGDRGIRVKVGRSGVTLMDGHKMSFGDFDGSLDAGVTFYVAGAGVVRSSS
jgi:hypothetical protein